MKRGAASFLGIIVFGLHALLFSEERVDFKKRTILAQAGDITFPLPPNATVQQNLPSGQQGHLPLSIRPAADHWEKRLIAGGWRLTGRESLTGTETSVHSTWHHLTSGRNVHLLLMASTQNRTLYIWHLSHPDKEKPQ